MALPTLFTPEPATTWSFFIGVWYNSDISPVSITDRKERKKTKYNNTQDKCIKRIEKEGAETTEQKRESSLFVSPSLIICLPPPFTCFRVCLLSFLTRSLSFCLLVNPSVCYRLCLAVCLFVSQAINLSVIISV